MNLSLQIRVARMNAELTTQELADKTGFTREAIERLEDGTIFPDVRHITSIAKALGFNEGYFLREMVYGKR